MKYAKEPGLHVYELHQMTLRIKIRCRKAWRWEITTFSALQSVLLWVQSRSERVRSLSSCMHCQSS